MTPQAHNSQEFHPPVEEYLEAIHTLGEEGTSVIQARIAERIGRSAPSVSEMLSRLEEEGYIARSGRTFSLTSSGADIARRVVRKHRLAERLLVDIIGLEWHKAHMEAGRWEHVISDEVEERLVLLLGNPATCPHGNPIPGGPETDPSNEQFRLADADEGMAVRLERVTEEVEIDTEALSYLGVKGFVTGSVAQVVSKRSGVLELAMGSETFELPSRICTHLFVTIVDSDASTSSAA